MESAGLMGYKGLAEMLGVAEGTLRHWVMEGRLPHIKVGSHVRFSRAQIDGWLAERTRGARPAAGGQLELGAGGRHDGR